MQLIPTQSIVNIVIIVGIVFVIIQGVFFLFVDRKKLRQENERLLLNIDLNTFKKNIIEELSPKLKSQTTELSQNVSTAIDIICPFSDRQLEIGLLIAQGKTSKETAEDLKISTNIVNNEIEIMRSLCGAKNRSELVVYLIKNQIV